jgi:hypothetical protein
VNIKKSQICSPVTIELVPACRESGLLATFPKQTHFAASFVFKMLGVPFSQSKKIELHHQNFQLLLLQHDGFILKLVRQYHNFTLQYEMGFLVARIFEFLI